MTDPKPGWKSSEFWLMVAALSFAMWAGYYALTNPEVELDRFMAILGTVGAFAGVYTQQRTSLKKTPRADERR